MTRRFSRCLASGKLVVAALVVVAGCKRTARPGSETPAASAVPKHMLGPNEVQLVVKEVAQNVSSFARRVASEKGEPANVVVYRRNSDTCAYGRVVGDSLAHIGSLEAKGHCVLEPFGRLGQYLHGTVSENNGATDVDLSVRLIPDWKVSDDEPPHPVYMPDDALPWRDGQMIVGHTSFLDDETSGPKLDLAGLSCPEGTDPRAHIKSADVEGRTVIATVEAKQKCEKPLPESWIWRPDHDGRPLPPRAKNIRSSPAHGWAGGPDGVVWFSHIVGTSKADERLMFFVLKGDAFVEQAPPPGAQGVSRLGRGDAGTTWALTYETAPPNASGIKFGRPSKLWLFRDRWLRVIPDGGPEEGIDDIRVIGRDVWLLVKGRLLHGVE